MYVEAFNDKQDEHYNDLLYVAWHTAAFQRQKKMPSLKSILKKKRKKPVKKSTGNIENEFKELSERKGLKFPNEGR